MIDEDALRRRALEIMGCERPGLHVKATRFKWMEDEPPFVPLSVREGGWRDRLGWRVKLAREAVALWLAPWLRRR